MAKNQWVIQEQLTENSDADWDTWVIGTIQEGMFIEIYRTHEKKAAIRAVEVFEWFETFEEGIIVSPEKTIEKINTKISKRKAPKGLV